MKVFMELKKTPTLKTPISYKSVVLPTGEEQEREKRGAAREKNWRSFQMKF